ncbi:MULTISPECIES: hypothetical protein [Vibrio]|uniref:Uncharacterized protein n=1 Tax=Vibrio tasmaniensis TaxID=212663 RepID=A0A2N7NCP2_9VIBR|nr:hypothetical protein [Vibrio tasmaniensis]PMO89867.1 hypothetical protein BCT01_00880 [Vibrio tasmaniensis]PMP09961.1 hypothetical protein BCS92_02210 [Vibrio tasmaniensis]TKG27972.1 hypothetical protein FC057_22555 [Vibrio tasmaniensis]TKG40543.1 hypothetical protein FC060_23830 [Vibrio tasmaniensis]TKG41663.1 hypothetical protein FC063_07315 [Vibrio tasmaniensis]
MGLIAGGAIGGGVALVTPKTANAFSMPLSPEELMEQLIEQGGAILMRFLGYRFSSNFQDAFDRYTDNNKETTKEKNGDMAKNITQSYEATIFKMTELMNHEISLDLYTPSTACANGELSKANNRLNKAIGSATPKARNTIHEYFEIKSENLSEAIFYRNKTFSTLLNSQGEPEFKELEKLIGVSHFDDTKRAEQEIAALIGDRPSYEDSTSNLDAIVNQSDQIKENIVIDALMGIFIQRIASSNVPVEFRKSLSSELNKMYPNSKLSSIELLHLETLSLSSNELFNNAVSNSPSLTTAIQYYNPIQAVENKIQVERLKIAELRNLVKSSSKLESENG